MRDKLLEFLKALEALFPPRAGTHHVLFHKTAGGYDHLALLINSRLWETDKTLSLEAGDLEKPVTQLIDEIARLFPVSEPEENAPAAS